MTSAPRWSWALAALAVTAAARPLAAQLPLGMVVGLGGASTQIHATTQTGSARYTGTAVGGGGQLGRGRLGLEAVYRQGSMTPDSGALVSQDLVEGRLLAYVRALPWLRVMGGVHAQAFTSPAGTERWMLYEGRVRADGRLVGDGVRAYVVLWGAFGGSVNINTGAPGGRGGEAGLTFYLPRSPAWGRLSYGISHTSQGGSTNTRTIEDLSIQVGIGGR